MKGSGSYGSSVHHSGSNLRGGHGNQGDDHRRGPSSPGGAQHHWEQPNSGHSHGQSLMASSSHNFISDSERSDMFSDYDDVIILNPDDALEAEIYLRPGEPYGTLLMPVEDPYNRSAKIEEANRELFNTPQGRKTHTKVRIWEDRNEYYNIEDNIDSSPSDYSMMNEDPYARRRESPQSPSHGDPSHQRRASPRHSPPRN